MEDRIKEIEKQIEFYKKKIQKSHEKLDKATKKHNKEIEDITHELYPLNEEHDKLIIEQWIERGKQGLNKGMNTFRNFHELPIAVRGEYYKIRDKVRGGCTGDWYDGCRGCDTNCESKAVEEFNKMFGF